MLYVTNFVVRLSYRIKDTKIGIQMKLQVLQSGYRKMVQRDDALILKLAEINDVRFASVERWLRTNSIALTTATNLTLIRQHFGLPETEILTTEDDVLI